MQVELVELFRVRLEMHEAFVTAHGTEGHRDLVLVRLTGTDGGIGWGECSTLARPTYTGEFTAGAWMVLRDELVPALLAGVAPGISGNPMAMAAMDTALTDLRLRTEGRSLSDELGTRSEGISPTAVVGRQATIDQLLGRIESRVAEGIGSVKLKVSPDWDLEPLRAVRDAWPGLVLAADANGSYPWAADVPAALDDLGLAYLEQPLGPDALADVAALAARLSTPIALDESIRSVASLDTAMAVGALAMVNVKPARLGGLRCAADVIRRAGELGVVWFVGGMLESGVGRASALCVAGIPGGAGTDLGPSHWYFDEDITPAIDLDSDGRIRAPDGTGIGVVPDPDRLAAATVEHLTFRR